MSKKSKKGVKPLKTNTIETIFFRALALALNDLINDLEERTSSLKNLEHLEEMLKTAVNEERYRDAAELKKRIDALKLNCA